jgi:hypothetical protein
MRIDNIRVLNNHKVKLINVKLTGVDSITSVVSEQGTRTPVVPTTTPGPSFQEKFDLVFDYLLKRYEPGWSGSDDVAGRTATMELLGISGATNPLLLGGSVEAAFNLNTSSDEGWFDPLVHPKDFATTVLTAYKKFDRARKPSKAQHRFVDRQPYGVGAYSYRDDGGNMFFNTTANFRWYPEDQTIPIRSTGFDENYQNKIERMMLRLPYGHFRSPMSYSDNVARQSLPWISDRYSLAQRCWCDPRCLSWSACRWRHGHSSEYSISRSFLPRWLYLQIHIQ